MTYYVVRNRFGQYLGTFLAKNETAAIARCESDTGPAGRHGPYYAEIA